MTFKGGYIGEYIGDYSRGYKGDARSLDYSLYVIDIVCRLRGNAVPNYSGSHTP